MIYFFSQFHIQHKPILYLLCSILLRFRVFRIQDANHHSSLLFMLILFYFYLSKNGFKKFMNVEFVNCLNLSCLCVFSHCLFQDYLRCHSLSAACPYKVIIGFSVYVVVYLDFLGSWWI